MRSVFNFIFALTVSLNCGAETAQVTVDSLRSMDSAAAEALIVEKDCEEIARHPICQVHKSSLMKLTRDINACHLAYAGGQCDAFFRDHPNMRAHKSKCNFADACRARNHLALLEGCKAAGIEFSKATTGDCKKGWLQGICISGHLIYSSFESLIPYLKGPLFGGRSILGDAYRATKSADYYARHFACLDTEMQNKIACYVAVGAGSVVVTKGASALKFEALASEVEGLDAATIAVRPSALRAGTNRVVTLAGKVTARATTLVKRGDALVADNDVYAVSNKSFRGGKKINVIATPVSSWGGGPNAKSLFNLWMRVPSSEDSKAFAESLSREIQSQTGEHLSVTETQFGYRIGDRYEIRVHGLTQSRRLLPSQGEKELEVTIIKGKDEVKASADLKKTLETSFNLRRDSNYLGKNPGFDLSHPDGAANYGRAVFAKFTNNLSSDAQEGFRLISGPDYREILPYLRTGQRRSAYGLPSQQIDEYVSAMDHAIAGFKTSRPLKLYRAVAGDNFDKIWDTLSSNPKAKVPPISDKAYSFTSIDEGFVESWNRIELKGNGVVLEVRAPAGTHAGFIERDSPRDYAEVVLPRNQSLKVIGAYRDAKGTRRLIVEVAN